MKTYVTFKKDHIHSIAGHIFDKDCIAVINSRSVFHGRNKAFEIFGGRFYREYAEMEFNMDWIRYFPRGFIEIN